MNQDIYNYLSEPENFDVAIALTNSLEEFKIELTKKFWKEIEKLIRKKVDSSKWDVSIDSEIFNTDNSKIYISLKNSNSNIFYTINVYNRKFFYGIYIVDELKDNKKDEIFLEAKNLIRKKGWKSDNNWHPLFQNLNQISIISDQFFRKLLPNKIQQTAEEVVSTVLNNFTTEIQDFIKKYS